MKSDIYSLEITIGEVTLYKTDGFNQIDAIAKFSNFEPFELFSQISVKSNAVVSSNSTSKEKFLEFRIDKRKCAIFSCPLQELYDLLLKVPLYIVLADWTQTIVKSNYPQSSNFNLIDSIKRTESKFQMVGITKISLNKLIYSLENQIKSYEEAKSNCIRGQFPIRNSFGHIVGHICLRVCLLCMPSKYSDLIENGISNEPMLCAEDDFQTRSGQISLGNMKEKEVQTLNWKIFNALDHSTQTERQEEIRKYEIMYDQIKQSPDTCHGTVISSLPKVIYTPVTNQTQNDFENLELGSFQPTGLCFTRSSDDEFVRSVRLSTGRENSNAINQQSIQNQLAQRNVQSSITDNRFIASNLESPSAGDYPTLQCLLTELQKLQQKNPNSKPSIMLEDISHLIGVLSGKSSAPETARTKNSFITNHKYKPSMRNEPNVMERQARLRRLAVPRERPPPPGQLVPKDRGWLRSAPVYRGPSQCSLTPRLTLTHYLRLQQIKTKSCECLHGTSSVKCYHTKKTSVSFSQQADQTVKHGPRLKPVTKSVEISKTQNFAKPVDLDINPSFMHDLESDEPISNLNENPKSSSKLELPGLNLLGHDDPYKSSSNETWSSDNPNLFGQTNAIQSGPMSSDNQAENFRPNPPLQSHSPPQFTLRKRSVNPPKYLGHDSDLAKAGPSSDMDPAIQKHNDTSSSHSMPTDQHRNTQPGSLSKCSSESSKSKEDSSADEGDNSYTEEFENTDEDTSNTSTDTTGKDNIKSKTSEKSNECSKLKNHIASSNQALSSSNSKPQIQSNDTILDCTGPWTSFTAVTGLLELQPTPGTMDFLTDTNIEQYGLSESEKANNKDSWILQNSVNPQPDLSTLVDDDLDIEQMRARGSHDFIQGGTVI